VNDIIMIGGPNGAGKTTAAQTLLPRALGLLEFVNADNIALGLSPFNPEGVAVAAGRVMLERMHELARGGTSFALETTCAGRGHARFLRACQARGWRVTLIFLWLDHPDLALQRVAQRVRQGGHHIPPDVIARRYWAGLGNMLNLYLPLVDAAQIYDNTDGDLRLIARKRRETGFVVHNVQDWARLKRSIDERHDGP
jgi:predicted ABC-type ATPase